MVVFWFSHISSLSQSIQILLLPLQQEDGDLEETDQPEKYEDVHNEQRQ